MKSLQTSVLKLIVIFSKIILHGKIQTLVFFLLVVSVSFDSSVTFTICCVHHLAPAAPPQDVFGQSHTPESISIEWQPPPSEHQNGQILGYKVLFVVNEDGKTVTDAESVEVSDTSVQLNNLQIFTEYKIWVLAFTSAGDSPMSPPIVVRTRDSGR